MRICDCWRSGTEWRFLPCRKRLVSLRRARRPNRRCPAGAPDVMLSPRPAAQRTRGHMTSEIAPRQPLPGERSLEPRHPNFLSELHCMPPRKKTRSEPQSRKDANRLSSGTARTRSGKKPRGSFRQKGVHRLRRKFRSRHSGFVGDANGLLWQGTGEPGAKVSALGAATQTGASKATMSDA